MVKDKTLDYYYQNHPYTLREVEDIQESYLLKQKLDLAVSWSKFSQTFAFVDLSIILDSFKTEAYQTMVAAEEEDRKKLPGYHSDSWLKGRLEMIADLKHYINEQLNSPEMLAMQLQEAQETEQMENDLT